jgi:transposase
MELWSEVRRRVFTGELTKRAARQEYHLHWDTLTKILENAEPPGYRKLKEREKPVLGPFIPLILEILEADKKAPPKQRHTVKRIFERLRERGYAGGMTVVGEEVRRIKQRSAEVFMPLAHRPGEAQCDFGEATAVYRGQERKIHFFVMTLPFSDALFCQAFPRECTESFQEGHRRAFEFFGGVPKRITYDNSKIAVTKIIQKRGGVFTAEFLRLESHYLFAHHFCLVRRPCEKGHTETLVGYSRRNFMVPIPEFDDFEVFNGQLAESCRQDLQRKLRGKADIKAVLLEDDRRAMLPLPPNPFEARRVEPCQASSLSLVRFDCNDYSVPTQYAHQAMMAIGGIEKVRFVVRDRVVAEHPRDWGKENVHYDPVHYLALLERKPGALDFGKPFDDWDLPEVFGVLRRRLEGELGQAGRREFIKVLRLLESCELKELARAVDRALQIGALTVEVVRLLLQDGREEPAKYFRLDGRPHLQGHEVPPPNLAVYNTLRQEDYCHVNNENTLTRGDLP